MKSQTCAVGTRALAAAFTGDLKDDAVQNEGKCVALKDNTVGLFWPTRLAALLAPLDLTTTKSASGTVFCASTCTAQGSVNSRSRHLLTYGNIR